MYQPYPRGSQPTEPPRPQPPQTIRTAALFMYAGALFSVLSGIVTVFSYRAVRHSHPHLNLRQVHALSSAEGITIVYTVVVIGMWLLLAWACQQGRNWARITGSALFAVDTVLVALNLIVRANAGVIGQIGFGLVPVLLVWLAGLGAVIMLWRPESGAFFAGASRS